MRIAFISLWITLVLSSFAQAAAPPGNGPDFDREIAPLLIRRCVDCHSGVAPKARLDLSRRDKALAVITPGDPEDSLLFQRVRDDEMPPRGKSLPAAEKELLRRWIASGARWGSDPIDPFRITTAERAGLDWWSLQPLARSQLPAGTTGHPIDRFLEARLRQKGLTFSAPADRRTLLRRLSFGLTGLPPTPEEVDAFLADRRPDAYQRVVDRLLASPAYGERWARHWLDIVRFGESDGFERDLPRPNAWPYRDWVVESLNADLPYDEFARLQIAGDQLRPGDADALRATGFLVAGPHDIVLPVVETMRQAMRQDELEDMVSTLGQTFLGLTVHCARCHDHKFDPIPQTDYYRLVASLAGVQHGERSLATAEDARRLAQLRSELATINQKLAGLEQPVIERLRSEKVGHPYSAPQPLAEWDFTRGLEDLRGKLHGTLMAGARRDAAGLHVDGKQAHVATPPLPVALKERTLEAWVRLDNLQQRGGGVISVQSLDGNTFDALVFGEQEPGRWLAGSEFFNRTQSFNGSVETEAQRRPIHLALTYHADGTISAYREGRPYGVAYRSSGPQPFAAGAAQVVFGLRHGTPGGNRNLAGTIVRARLYDRALRPDEVANSAGRPLIRPEEIQAHLPPSAREEYQTLCRQQQHTLGNIAALEERQRRKLYAVGSTQPPPTRLLVRGQVTSPRDIIAPERISALADRLPSKALPPDAPEGQRRLALADWITHRDNPLFARVLVNRLWQYHFGIGLVDTPSDFGFNGGRPSHPELLDWLASELIRQNYSLKAMHRLIVSSAAYQQSSQPRPEALRVDADNRLLWRRSPQRLEAEVVRDALLAASGRLDRRLGGPPYQDFRSFFFKGTQFYEPIEQIGPAFERRALYRMWARGGRNPFLDTLDCPDPSATTPRRAVTTTPLQALALFNNAFVLEQAEQLARRIKAVAPKEPHAQAALAYRWTLARPMTADERRVVEPFVQQHGLAALCRVLFNTSEFVQVD